MEISNTPKKVEIDNSKNRNLQHLNLHGYFIQGNFNKIKKYQSYWMRFEKALGEIWRFRE